MRNPVLQAFCPTTGAAVPTIACVLPSPVPTRLVRNRSAASSSTAISAVSTPSRCVPVIVPNSSPSARAARVPSAPAQWAAVTTTGLPSSSPLKPVEHSRTPSGTRTWYAVPPTTGPAGAGTDWMARRRSSGTGVACAGTVSFMPSMIEPVPGVSPASRSTTVRSGPSGMRPASLRRPRLPSDPDPPAPLPGADWASSRSPVAAPVRVVAGSSPSTVGVPSDCPPPSLPNGAVSHRGSGASIMSISARSRSRASRLPSSAASPPRVVTTTALRAGSTRMAVTSSCRFSGMPSTTLRTCRSRASSSAVVSATSCTVNPASVASDRRRSPAGPATTPTRPVPSSSSHTPPNASRNCCSQWGRASARRSPMPAWARNCSGVRPRSRRSASTSEVSCGARASARTGSACAAVGCAAAGAGAGGVAEGSAPAGDAVTTSAAAAATAASDEVMRMMAFRVAQMDDRWSTDRGSG